ncbi:MAG: AMP-binding protein [Myxococcota bacterium]
MTTPIGRSHVVGEATSLSDLTLSECLDATAARLPDREAVVFVEAGVRWTWAELRHQADRLAGGLLALGYAPGDRLGIWSPNRPEWILAQYATARIGVVLVNLNPAYRSVELDYALRKVGCKGVITAPSFKTSDYLALLQGVVPELATSAHGSLESPSFPLLRHVVRMGTERTPGMSNFDDLLASVDDASVARARAVGATLRRDDPINLQFTSGTTGHPKGATLTHRNLVNNARDVAERMALREGDRLCVPVPLYHCFGMVMSSLACAVTGATMVFPGEGFDAGSVLRAVHAERCTHLQGVPTMFIAELDHPEFTTFDLSSLRGGIMAGSPCPVEVMRRVTTEMHLREITIAYGMTETSPVSFQSTVDDPLERRVSTVGRVMPNLEVKIVDPDGQLVPVGEKGELCTRGYSVMSGYWDDAERTADAVRDGWMHTGDLATIDAEGYCNIVGRVKDMLIRGGENVYPREVEEFLFGHPAVAQAQVFGVPDPKYGEEVCAWIVLKPGAASTEDEIREYCRGRISHYKVPRYVRFVPELPMTVTGKAQKFVMRDRMIAELGLHEERTA